MKTHENEQKNRRAWYDPALRLWTMQHLDPEGNQVGAVTYETSAVRALRWLNDQSAAAIELALARLGQTYVNANSMALRGAISLQGEGLCYVIDARTREEADNGTGLLRVISATRVTEQFPVPVTQEEWDAIDERVVALAQQARIWSLRFGATNEALRARYEAESMAALRDHGIRFEMLVDNAKATA